MDKPAESCRYFNLVLLLYLMTPLAMQIAAALKATVLTFAAELSRN